MSLIESAKDDDLPKVKTSIAGGADVNAVDGGRRTRATSNVLQHSSMPRRMLTRTISLVTRRSIVHPTAVMRNVFGSVVRVVFGG